MNDEQKLEANLAAVRMLGYEPWHENGAVFYRVPMTAVDPGVAEIFPDGIPAHFDMFTRAQDTLAVVKCLGDRFRVTIQAERDGNWWSYAIDEEVSYEEAAAYAVLAIDRA